MREERMINYKEVLLRLKGKRRLRERQAAEEEKEPSIAMEKGSFWDEEREMIWVMYQLKEDIIAVGSETSPLYGTIFTLYKNLYNKGNGFTVEEFKAFLERSDPLDLPFILGPILQAEEITEEVLCSLYNYSNSVSKRHFQSSLYLKKASGIHQKEIYCIDKHRTKQHEIDYEQDVEDDTGRRGWRKWLSAVLTLGLAISSAIIVFSCAFHALPLLVVIGCSFSAFLISCFMFYEDLKTTIYEAINGRFFRHVNESPFSRIEKIFTSCMGFFSFAYGLTMCCMTYDFMMSSEVLGFLGFSLSVVPTGWLIFSVAISAIAIVCYTVNTFRAIIDKYKKGDIGRVVSYLKEDFFSLKTKEGYRARGFLERSRVVLVRVNDALSFGAAVVVAVFSTVVSLGVWRSNVFNVSYKFLNKATAIVVSDLLVYVPSAISGSLFIGVAAVETLTPILGCVLVTVASILTAPFLLGSPKYRLWIKSQFWNFGEKSYQGGQFFLQQLWRLGTTVGDMFGDYYFAVSGTAVYKRVANAGSSFATGYKYMRERSSPLEKRKGFLLERIVEKHIVRATTVEQLVALFHYTNSSPHAEILKKRRHSWDIFNLFYKETCSWSMVLEAFRTQAAIVCLDEQDGKTYEEKLDGFKAAELFEESRFRFFNSGEEAVLEELRGKKKGEERKSVLTQYQQHAENIGLKYNPILLKEIDHVSHEQILRKLKEWDPKKLDDMTYDAAIIKLMLWVLDDLKNKKAIELSNIGREYGNLIDAHRGSLFTAWGRTNPRATLDYLSSSNKVQEEIISELYEEHTQKAEYLELQEIFQYYSKKDDQGKKVIQSM